jgi:hypothetical protein
MSCVDGFGVKVGLKVERRPLLSGTDPEIRGVLAKLLVSSGLNPARAGRLIGISRSQVYVDLKVADRRIAEASSGEDSTP